MGLLCLLLDRVFWPFSGFLDFAQIRHFVVVVVDRNALQRLHLQIIGIAPHVLSLIHPEAALSLPSSGQLFGGGFPEERAFLRFARS